MLDKKRDIRATTLIAYVMFMASLFGGNMLGVSFDGITFSAYRIIIVVAVLVSIFDKRFINTNLLKIPCYIKLLFMWLGVSLIQTAWSNDFNKSFRLLIVFASFCFITYFAYCFIAKKGIFKRVILFMVIGVAINEYFCLYEIFTGKYFNLVGETDILYYGNYIRNIFNLYVPIAYFGNPNNVALFCLIANTVILIAFQIVKKKGAKFLMVLLALVNLFVWVSAGSRTGYITIVLFLALYLLFSLGKTDANWVKVLSVPLLAVAAFYVLFNMGELFTEGSDMIRLNLIKNGFIILFKNSFGFGVGLGGIEHYMAAYTNTAGIVNMHNLIMELLVTAGIPLFAYMVYVYALGIKKLAKIRYSTKNYTNKVISKIMLCYLISFIFASIGPSYSFDLDFIWPLFAIIMVFICSINGDISMERRNEINHSIIR